MLFSDFCSICVRYCSWCDLCTLVMEMVVVSDCWANFMFRIISIYLPSWSFITLTAMTFEIYMVIFYPFIHRTKVTRGRLLKYIACVCLATLFLNLLCLILVKVVEITNGILTFIFLATFVCTGIILFAKEQFGSRRSPRDGAVEFFQEVQLLKS